MHADLGSDFPKVMILCSVYKLFGFAAPPFGVLSIGPYAGLRSYGIFRTNPGSDYQMSGIAKLITRLSEMYLNFSAEQA